MNGFRLAIDYGTSNTIAVLAAPDGRARPLLFDGAPLLPSAVYAEPDGTIITGLNAQRSARLDPTRYEPNPKRRIDDGEVLLGEAAVPLAELAAVTLRRVAAEATRTANAPITGLVMTHPVEWGQARRGMLTDAAARAGLPRPALVPEPVAAATYFVSALGHQVPVGRCVIVYDLGGGTFDACVVRRTATGFEPLSYRGISDFGGVDLDGLIVSQVGAAVSAAAPEVWRRLSTPTDDTDRRHFRTLWDDARNAKESLSRQPHVSLFVPIMERDVHVSREKFEAAARPALARTVEVTIAAIREARVQPADVAGIFLVGGSTRVPMVATMLHQATRTAPAVIEQPEIVVAEGALFATRPGSAPPQRPPAQHPMSSGTAQHTMSPFPTQATMAPGAGSATGPIAPGMPVSSVPVSSHPAAMSQQSAPPAPFGGQPPGPGRPVPARAPAGPYGGPPRRSRKLFIIPICIGAVLVVVVALTIGIGLARGGNKGNVEALYQQVGLPKGFTEQAEPSHPADGSLKVIATASRKDGNDPTGATHTWLGTLMNSPPSVADLESTYFDSPNGPQILFDDKHKPHMVTLHLSKNGDVYKIDLDLIY